MSYLLTLEDIRVNRYETTVGTCELCFSTKTISEPTFRFKVFDSETMDYVTTIDVEGFYWSYGDLMTVHCDNVVAFAEWFDNKKVVVDDYRGFGYSDLSYLCDEYTYGGE